MESIKLSSIVEQWNSWAIQPHNKHFDIAILKIWIQFERSIGVLFNCYILGNKSSENYCPERLLHFDSISQYKKLTSRSNEKYIDYLKHSKEKSKLIFKPKDNPFETIFMSEPFSIVINAVQALRNYIVHESQEAKRKYINTCLGGTDKENINPNKHLQQMKKKVNKTYFTYYTEILVEAIRYCENPKN